VGEINVEKESERDGKEKNKGGEESLIAAQIKKELFSLLLAKKKCSA